MFQSQEARQGLHLSPGHSPSSSISLYTALTIHIETLIYLYIIPLTCHGVGSSGCWRCMRLPKLTKKFSDLGGLQVVTSLFLEGARYRIETLCKLVKFMVTTALERQLSEQLNCLKNLLVSGWQFGNCNFCFSTFLWFLNLSPVASQLVFMCRMAWTHHSNQGSLIIFIFHPLRVRWVL